MGHVVLELLNEPQGVGWRYRTFAHDLCVVLILATVFVQLPPSLSQPVLSIMYSTPTLFTRHHCTLAEPSTIFFTLLSKASIIFSATIGAAALLSAAYMGFAN